MSDTDPLASDPYRTPQWYACRTRGRAEKQVDRLLKRAGIEAYLPLVERERQWADRRKRVAFPLFPGYTFARFRLLEAPRVAQTPGLVNVLSGSGRGLPTPVPEAELESVRILAEGIAVAGIEAQVTDWLQEGVEVEVTSGPFRGMRGILIEADGSAQVAVQLSGIRLGARVEIARAHLRPAA